MTLRQRARNVVLTSFAYIDQISGVDDLLRKPRVQFIYFHHVFKDEEQKLRRLLQRLLEHHTYISYSEAVTRVLKSQIDRPYICISSDDGFRNNLNAATIFNEFGVKACFFINPGLIGESNFQTIAEHCERQLHLPPIEFLNWDEVNQIQNSGHEIGSHTMMHNNIAQTDISKVVDDMHMTYNTLTKHCGHVEHFAYPYGRYVHFTKAARQACFEAGFTSCATAERGCHVNHGGPISREDLCIRRDHIVLDWKIDHVFYFLSNNSRNARPQGNLYPDDWI